MKFHYQYVSKSSVRIELIPEDKKETTQIELLAKAGQEDNPSLDPLFQAGLEGYCASGKLTRLKFMGFPRVALCSFEKPETPISP